MTLRGNADAAFANRNFMKLSNHQENRLREAGALIRSGRPADALPILDDLLANAPTHVWALAERGRAKTNTGDHHGALADFTTIIGIEPNVPKSYTLRAMARERAGDSAGAIDDYNAAIVIDPRHAFAYLSRGRIQIQFGNLEAALSDFTATIRYDKMGPLSGLLNRGKTKHLMGDFPGAIEDLTAALHLEGGPAIFSPLYRGQSRKCAGDLNGALADFTDAIQAYPQLTNAYRHRAEIRHILGDVTGEENDRREYEKLGGADLPAYS